MKPGMHSANRELVGGDDNLSQHHAINLLDGPGVRHAPELEVADVS